jgi:hypothetical protein
MSKMKPFTKEGDKTGPNDSAGSYSLFVYCRASTQQIPYLKDIWTLRILWRLYFSHVRKTGRPALEIRSSSVAEPHPLRNMSEVSLFLGVENVDCLISCLQTALRAWCRSHWNHNSRSASQSSASARGYQQHCAAGGAAQKLRIVDWYNMGSFKWCQEFSTQNTRSFISLFVLPYLWSNFLCWFWICLFLTYAILLVPSKMGFEKFLREFQSISLERHHAYLVSTNSTSSHR